MNYSNITNISSICLSFTQDGLDAFAITMLVLIICNIIFHSIGCYLLFRLYKNGRENVQQIYLINLSITHSLGNVFQLISRILIMIDLIEMYLYIIAALLTVFTLSYYMSMTYITVDKALDILLNIKYPIYWNEYRAKLLVYATWLLGIIIFTCVFAMHFFKKVTIDRIADFLFLYIYPTFDFSFIFLAVICYGFLFYKYKQSRIVPGSMIYKNGMKVVNGQRRSVSASVFKTFQTSRFYISVLLILTFLVFMVLPNLIYLFYGIVGGNKSATLDDALLILFNFSYLFDAWIYIFAQRSVRNLFRRKLNRKRDWFQSTMHSRTSVVGESIMLHMRRLTGTTENVELKR